MSLHSTLGFADIHTAKLKSGLAASRSSTPDGVGDIFYATDTQVLSVTNTAGSAWVTFSGAGAVSLDDLTDVTITTPTDGQALVYQSGVWINGTTAVALNDLVDVTITTPAAGDALYYDTGSSTWKNKSGDFDDLANVLITTAALGNIVVFQGGEWKNLPTGSNGLFLKANSGATYGIEWAAGGGGSSTLAGLSDVDIGGQAKGDLFASEGSTDWGNLPVGTNGQVLYADNSQVLGLKWDNAPAAGGTNALENAWTVIPSKPAVLTNVNNTPTTIFAPTSGNTTRINSVIFYANDSTDAQTVNLYYWDGAVSNLLASQYIQKAGTWVFKPEHPILLPDNYELRASSTDNSATTALVSGGFMTTPITGFVPTHFLDGQTNGSQIDLFTVDTGITGYLGHVIAYCYGTTSVTTGATFSVLINDGSDDYVVGEWCFRQGEYLVLDLGITLDEGWTASITGTLDKTNFWADGALTS